jgi:hypothetical protein
MVEIPSRLTLYGVVLGINLAHHHPEYTQALISLLADDSVGPGWEIDEAECQSWMSKVPLKVVT